MSGLKNSENLKKLAKIISFYLVKIYQSNKNESAEILLPKGKEKFLPLLLNPNLLYFVVVVILSGVILKDVLELSHPSKDLKKSPLDSADKTKDLLDLANQNKNLPKLPLSIPFPGWAEKRLEKRILPLDVCCSYSINQYVIFTRKNKNNPSSVNINCGEIGQVIKKLDGWERALVDFDIKVPSRFEKFNTKSIAEKALNEGIVIFEERHLKN